MGDGDLLILKGKEVMQLLEGREEELLDTVKDAYIAHGAGYSALPHSTFLHLPGDDRNRIIALPAYLGQDFQVAGLKWVSSFPLNLEKGLDRASAIIVLNSTQTGLPEAIIEGSIISAKRTAASAALAARYLQEGQRAETAALVGCGLINFEIARFLLTACPEIKSFVLYDLDPARMDHFEEQSRESFPEIEVTKAEGLDELLGSSTLISLATTVVRPHILDLSACPPRTTILHISLRDLSANVILASDNVVDDVDHVCRAQTSIHLAMQLIGHREFIRCTLAEVLNGTAPPRKDDGHVIFSPFGLGILDLAVARRVRELSLERLCGDDHHDICGEIIEGFLPPSW